MSFLRRVEIEETNVGHNDKIDFQQEPFFHHIVKKREGGEPVFSKNFVEPKCGNELMNGL